MRAILIGLACLLAWSSLARASCQFGAVAVLPLRDNTFLFTADVNGKPANLFLDTGSYATMLTLNSAQRLGVTMSALDSESYGIGGVRHTYSGTAKRMRIGNMDADGIIVGGTGMFDQTPDATIDGLFGMNMMAAYDIDLDIIGQHVIIFQADGACGRPAAALAPPLYIVPLVSIDRDRQTDVDITINGDTIRAVIDSGASHTVMFRGAARRLGVDLAALHAEGHHLDRGIGPRAVASMTHVFEKVVIGDLTINNMPIAIIDQANLGIDRIHTGSRLVDTADGESGGEDMLLGADFMRKVHLWISHSSHHLIMQFPPQPSVLPK